MSQDGEYERGYRNGREDADQSYEIHKLNTIIELLKARLRVEGSIEETKE